MVRIDSCVLLREEAGLLRLELDAGRGEARSRLAVVSARRDDLPSRMTAPRGGVRPAGGAGMWIDGSSR